jgi:hypothetical protein
MSLLYPVGTTAVGIQQLITAGSQFEGSKSTSAQTSGNGMTKFATDTKGGLFNFEQTEPIVVHNVMADFGSSIAYQVFISNLDAAGAIISGESMLYASGTAATLSLASRITLGVNQAVFLKTTTATVAMIGRCWATTCRGFQG